MSVDASGDVIILRGEVRVEEAELIVAALSDRWRAVDICEARHLHGAVAQALLTLGAVVTGEPADPFLRDFVLPIFRQAGGARQTPRDVTVGDGYNPSAAVRRQEIPGV